MPLSSKPLAFRFALVHSRRPFGRTVEAGSLRFLCDWCGVVVVVGKSLCIFPPVSPGVGVRERGILCVKAWRGG